ncbi:MAG: hypothetical protein JKX95_09375 [Bacteroidia bacterium]|nr:hypothetical protein [Bacteroidia bacterium]
MKDFDVVLLTESRYDQPTEVGWYIENILTEDGMVKDALEKKGLKVARVDWANPNFDWSSTEIALFRTTWDYFNRFEEFSNWLNEATTKTRLINPAEQIRWNIDKHYLRDLENKGINITPTVYIEPRETINLPELHEKNNWKETVLKPAIAGAARHTYRLDQDNLSEHEDIFQELISSETMMLQPFQYNVIEQGEVAYMLFGGKFTHAVLKVAKPGDFRVQDDFGGTVHQYDPTNEEIEFAERAVLACDPLPVYARVDVITDNNDKLSVTELELIEPELWFRFHPPAADKLAETVIDILTK